MKIEELDNEQLKNLMEKQAAEIIDVREKSEYKIVKLKTAKLIPMEELNYRLGEIDWSKKVVFICRSGARSRRLAQEYSTKDRMIANLDGGLKACYYRSSECLEIDDYSQADIYFN